MQQLRILESRWQEFWPRLNAAGNDVMIFSELLQRYSEPLRAYHDLRHLLHCIVEFDFVRAQCPEPDAAELALWFHDAVYDAKAKDNEERSAELMRKLSGGAGVSAAIIDRAAAIIMVTKTHQPVDETAKVIVDCDLAILGQPAELYGDYERNIRTEYGWVPEDAYRKGRADVLKKFLDRPSIYHTPWFQKKYEATARKNLLHAIEQLQSAPLLTRLRTVDPDRPPREIMAEAADVLRAGGLVAFPTETVYGLGANALNPDAVARIFVAKGRPSNNPLIVHVPDAEAAKPLVEDWPYFAEQLTREFWPGPLTLVIERSALVPDAVTGGGGTVALRAPNHPVALSLLKAAGVPIAAPSANRSTEVSPTLAEHVLKSLDGRIDLLIDGGSCFGGIESTVLDLTTSPPSILRPGLISPLTIESVIGPIARTAAPSPGTALLSPGMMERHYAPRAPVELARDLGEALVRERLSQKKKVGWILARPNWIDDRNLVCIELPPEPAGFSAGLYAALHSLDDSGVDVIVITMVPPDEPWLAIRDRLKRAAAKQSEAKP